MELLSLYFAEVKVHWPWNNSFIVFGLQTSNNIVIFSIASYAHKKVTEIHNIK